MKAVVRFTLKQKIFFNIIFILLAVAGVFSMLALPTERYPDINMAIVTVKAEYPGASVTDVEALVTRKIEEAIEDIEAIEWISSSSQAGRVYIRIKLIDDSDYQKTYNEIRFKILNVKSDLPAEVDPPQIEDVTMGELLPVLFVNFGGEHNNRALSLIADQIKSSIQKIEGVKKVVVLGEFKREFHIYLSLEKLRRLGVAFDDVAKALQDVNISITAGNFQLNGKEYQIKVDEKLFNKDQVINTIIRRDGDGGFIRIEDVISHADFDYRKPPIISSVNGKNAVSISVIKSPEGNALEIKQHVLNILEDFKVLFDNEKVEFTLTQDSTIKINDGLSTLGWNLAVGMLLVSFITWYFVGTRNAGLITIGIPFSFLITLLVMYLTSYSFNEITLFAFVLVSGVIVDDAIVVTDNIYRYIQDGRQPYQAIIEGTAEVALPVIASSLTTIAAFLPLLLMTGTTGEFFAQIPAAVSFALLASLFECLFILPIHYLDFGPQKSTQLNQQLESDNFILCFFRSLTQKVLNWTLRFRGFTLLIIFLLFFVCIGIMYVSTKGILPLVKTKFFPDDYAVYFVDIKGAPNTSMNTIDSLAREISRTIMADSMGMAESTSAKAGVYMNEDYELVFGDNYGVVLVTLLPKGKRELLDPMEYLDQMRRKLKQKFEKDGFIISVHPMKEGPPSGKAINIKVMGSNINNVTKLADNLLSFLKSQDNIAPYLVDLEDDRGTPQKTYRFKILQDRVMEYDISRSAVARFAGSILDGRYIGKFRSSDEEIDLKLLLDLQSIDNPQQTLSIPFKENTVGPILLSDIAELQISEELGELHRYQGHRTISIKSDLKTGSPVSSPSLFMAVADYYDSIRNDYPGATILFSGEYENTQRSYESLMVAFFMAVMIIYMILAAQFQSYLQPAIVLSSVIFAIIGIVLGKVLTQSLFTVNSFIAVIGVVGVVVNDALVLLDFMNRNFRSGLSRRDSIDNAIKVRLRPIILTTITTMLGLLLLRY